MKPNENDRCRGCGKIIAGCAGECATCFGSPGATSTPTTPTHRPDAIDNLARRHNAAAHQKAMRTAIVGCTITSVIVDAEGYVTLMLKPPAAPHTLGLEIMSDPEGNGPGALHVTRIHDREPLFCGVVGGR